MKLSPKFPPHIKPYHIGVYLVSNKWNNNKLEAYSYWNGYEWMGDRFDKDDAEFNYYISSDQNRFWKGIVK